MPNRDPWLDDFERRNQDSQRRFEESERRFYERLRRSDRLAFWCLVGIAIVWVCVGLAIKLLP